MTAGINFSAHSGYKYHRLWSDQNQQYLELDVINESEFFNRLFVGSKGQVPVRFSVAIFSYCCETSQKVSFDDDL